MAEKRIHYLDNIRIALTSIVIIHHLLISFGAPGGWYYKEFETAQLDLPTQVILIFAVAINQAYFMGFFFFLSGYFSGQSITAAPLRKFILQRVFRLGLPILLYVYLISPLLRLLTRRFLYHQALTLENLKHVYTSLTFRYELGPMWFILLLLILSLFLIPIIKNKYILADKTGGPEIQQIILFALLVGCLTYLIRIYLPVGSVFQPLNLQIPHTMQYIFLYIAGSQAYHGYWLDAKKTINSKVWSWLILSLLLTLPVVFVLSGGLDGGVTPALGGRTWQSLFYSIWEQLFCISMIITLVRIFRIYASDSSPLLTELSASSYAAYLVHPLVLVVITTLIDPIKIHPLWKISMLLLPSLVLTFLVAGLFRRIPGIKQII